MEQWVLSVVLLERKDQQMDRVLLPDSTILLELHGEWMESKESLAVPTSSKETGDDSWIHFNISEFLFDNLNLCFKINPWDRGMKSIIQILKNCRECSIDHMSSILSWEFSKADEKILWHSSKFHPDKQQSTASVSVVNWAQYGLVWKETIVGRIAISTMRLQRRNPSPWNINWLERKRLNRILRTNHPKCSL